MRTSEAIVEITKGLGQFQEECPSLKKDAKGYGYNYTTLDSIIETVKPLLLKHGIIFIQSIGMCDHGHTMTTRLQHVSGEWIEDTMVMPKMGESKSMNIVQAMGASITYVKRYSLSAILGISTEDDTDGITQNKGN
jgi:hypothetical protein